IGYYGDYSFDVYNDDYHQLPPDTVAQRAQRAALWLGETGVRRPLPAPKPGTAAARRQSRMSGKMEYKRLGASGLEVSPVCLGTMMFGDRTDATEAQRIVDAAFASGVNFVDTADAYGNGKSEEI